MPRSFTSSGRSAAGKPQRLEPLTETLQLGTRAYRALASGIVGGQIEPGTQLRPDTIAEQLEISVTPVREALYRLEGDGLLVKLPYQGWFVREFTEQEVRQLYEMRAAMECFAVRLACQRMTSRGARRAPRTAVGRQGGASRRGHRCVSDLQPRPARHDHQGGAELVSLDRDGAARPSEPDADGADDSAGRPPLARPRGAR